MQYVPERGGNVGGIRQVDVFHSSVIPSGADWLDRGWLCLFSRPVLLALGRVVYDGDSQQLATNYYLSGNYDYIYALDGR